MRQGWSISSKFLLQTELGSFIGGAPGEHKPEVLMKSTVRFERVVFGT